jgi:hypothetical protein
MGLGDRLLGLLLGLGVCLYQRERERDYNYWSSKEMKRENDKPE